MKKMVLLILTTALTGQSMRTHPSPGLGDYTAPFFKGGSYRADIQSPSEFLGFELGGRSITHAEVMSYFTYLSETAPNAQLNVYAHSFEGRELVYLVDRSGEMHVLRRGDPVFLGRLTKIDMTRSRVEFELNRGGIWGRHTLTVGAGTP